jgi:C1A family cysteine protease
MSHLTDDEYHSQYLTLSPNDLHTRSPFIPQANVDIPEMLDWREHHVINEIKNQGQCGSCWAFAITSVMESSIAIQHGQLIVLSEQQLIDCDYTNNGCGGGVIRKALNYLISGNGSCDEGYVYHSSQGVCNSCRNVVKLVKYFYYSGEQAMLQGLQRGPIIAALDMTLLKEYGKGIIDESIICTNDINHAVVIVGYGVEDETKYWIVRNSWGKLWGEDGYFRILRGVDKCSIERYSYGVNTVQIGKYVSVNQSNDISLIIGVGIIVVIMMEFGLCVYMLVTRRQIDHWSMDL